MKIAVVLLLIFFALLAITLLAVSAFFFHSSPVTGNSTVTASNTKTITTTSPPPTETSEIITGLITGTPTIKPVMLFSATKLRIRSCPSVECVVIAYLEPNTPLTYLDVCSDGWAKIQYDLKVGWSYAKYIEPAICVP